MNDQTPEGKKSIPKICCSNCLFGTDELIPDPAVTWKRGDPPKPKVPGHRCRVANPPTGAGFPAVPLGGFCGLFTDRETHDQPLRHLVSDAVKADGRDGR